MWGGGEGLDWRGVEELGEEVGVRGGGGASDELGGGRRGRSGFLEGEEGLIRVSCLYDWRVTGMVTSSALSAFVCSMAAVCRWQTV